MPKYIYIYIHIYMYVNIYNLQAQIIHVLPVNKSENNGNIFLDTLNIHEVATINDLWSKGNKI
jgi:hypothetical protein